jgi:hypothetical protein
VRLITEAATVGVCVLEGLPRLAQAARHQPPQALFVVRDLLAKAAAAASTRRDEFFQRKRPAWRPKMTRLQKIWSSLCAASLRTDNASLIQKISQRGVSSLQARGNFERKRPKRHSKCSTIIWYSVVHSRGSIQATASATDSHTRKRRQRAQRNARWFSRSHG